MSAGAARAWGFLALALAAVACGDGGGMEPGSPPTSMIALSLPVDTVTTGEQTDPPISVRVEDVLGNAVEGAPVSFTLIRGQGTLVPSIAVSGDDGVAESVFRAGATPGETEIRVDLPSAPNVSPLQFLVLTEAADSVLFSLVEGDVQRAEVGSQLPLPFVLRARTPAGGAAGGIEVAFRLDGAEEASALLTNNSILTDADGLGRTVLTLGQQARDYRVRAYAMGGVYSDTLEFSATASAAFDGSVVFDSVASGTLVAGAQAKLFGRGFSPVPAENDVRIEGESAVVLEASGTELTIQTPAFQGQCLPRRDVGIRVLIGSDASNGGILPLDPAEPSVELAVGEAVRLSGPQAVRCLQFSPSGAPREFRIAVGNASRVATGALSLRLATRVPTDLGAPGGSASVGRNEVATPLREAALGRTQPDAVVRSRTLAGLERSRVATARASRPADRALRVPAVGDTLEHFFAVQSDLTATCSDTANVVRGVVRALGQHLALVEDMARPAGGFEPADWTALSEDLERTVAVDTSYFGGYADIDGNGRVIVLFTPAVNELGAGQAGLGGFYLPLDLAASGRGGGGLPGAGGETCPASNEAEVIYLVAADPEGQAGQTIDKARALRNARGLLAHELQHLISAERRVLHSGSGFSASEAVWLDEALSSLAEEVAGLAAIGRSVGGDYAFDAVANTRAEFDAFNTYQLNNFLNLSFYMFDPSIAPTISQVDPGGVGGLQMRGFGWFLLRWLADQRGGDERAFFQSIVGGGQNFARGIDNLERVTGRQWDAMLSDFAVALATDDSGIEELPSQFEIATWDFRDVFASLNRNPTARSLFPIPFPLRAGRLSFETGALDFNVGASGVRYFSLASGLDAPALSVALGAPAGGALNENAKPQITIVRTR